MKAGEKGMSCVCWSMTLKRHVTTVIQTQSKELMDKGGNKM